MNPSRPALALLLALLLAAPGQAWSREASAGAADAARMLGAARQLLYPAWDPATGRTGESFRSPSLAREAPDMRLVEFRLAAVPASLRYVAAALLEPEGFPVPYTLLEVAVLERTGAGLRLLGNLKARVDSGSGPGGLRMRLPPPGRQAPRSVRFDVLVSDAAGTLRHRFRQDAKGITLLESAPAR